MNKILLLLILFIFAGCCHNVSKKDGSNDQFNKNQTSQKPPATITENQSIVNAKIEEINFKDDNKYSIKAKILEVEKNPAYESMAVKGNSYILTPNFSLDENKEINNLSKKNEELKDLSQLKIGDEFKAIIFFDGKNGWFIQKVLK